MQLASSPCAGAAGTKPKSLSHRHWRAAPVAVDCTKGSKHVQEPLDAAVVEAPTIVAHEVHDVEPTSE